MEVARCDTATRLSNPVYSMTHRQCAMRLTFIALAGSTKKQLRLYLKGRRDAQLFEHRAFCSLQFTSLLALGSITSANSMTLRPCERSYPGQYGRFAPFGFPDSTKFNTYSWIAAESERAAARSIPSSIVASFQSSKFPNTNGSSKQCPAPTLT